MGSEALSAAADCDAVSRAAVDRGAGEEASSAAAVEAVPWRSREGLVAEAWMLAPWGASERPLVEVGLKVRPGGTTTACPDLGGGAAEPRPERGLTEEVSAGPAAVAKAGAGEGVEAAEVRGTGVGDESAATGAWGAGVGRRDPCLAGPGSCEGRETDEAAGGLEWTLTDGARGPGGGAGGWVALEVSVPGRRAPPAAGTVVACVSAKATLAWLTG